MAVVDDAKKLESITSYRNGQLRGKTFDLQKLASEVDPTDVTFKQK